MDRVIALLSRMVRKITGLRSRQQQKNVGQEVVKKTPIKPTLPKPPRGWKPGDPTVSRRELDAAFAIRAAVEAQAEKEAGGTAVNSVSSENADATAPVDVRSIPEFVQATYVRARAIVVRAVARKKQESKSAPPMPRRMPLLPIEPRAFTKRELLVRSVLIIITVVIFGFMGDLMVLGNVQHDVAQQQLGNTFREQLASATAPVSEGDHNLVLLQNGAPVAIIDIPELGVHEVVVEGTDSATLKAGPGHRRDTVLPGQAGISVIMARATAYGGPFGNIQSLQPGTEFSVITGQGYHVYSVIGVRYAGDPGPAEPADGIGRLVLETARGGPFAPSGILRVDAQLVSTSKTAPGTISTASSGATPTLGATPGPTGTGTPTATPLPTVTPSSSAGATPTVTGTPGPVSDIRSPTITLAAVQALSPGARFTATNTLPIAERELATDTSTVWALIFGLQFLIIVEIAAIWAYRRVGPQKAWIVFLPALTLAGLLVSDQLVRLLPNLL